MPQLWRWYIIATSLVAAISLALAPFLFEESHDAAESAKAAAAQAEVNAENNAALICSLGELISSSPIAKRPDETDKEFRTRIFLLRDFARDLRMIEACDPDRPTRIHVAPEDRLGGGDATRPGPTGGGLPPASPSGGAGR